jgi:hypothetical protein
LPPAVTNAKEIHESNSPHRKLNKAKKISDTPLIWETGDWDVSEEAASALVAGDRYLHTAQDAPSHLGGRIWATSSC